MHWRKIFKARQFRMTWLKGSRILQEKDSMMQCIKDIKLLATAKAA